MKKADLLIVNAAELATMAGPLGPRRGKDLAGNGVIADGAVAVLEGVVAATGTTAEITSTWLAGEGDVIDAKGRLVTPGLVDPHTHLVFGGSREDEFEQRIRGKTYEEIAKAGGGINSTVERTRKATREELVASARTRLRGMLAHGTTTVEAKSGYGLTLADELKCLEVVRELSETESVDLVPTFMGAHEIPREYAARREEYVDQVIREMIPEVAKRRLAVFCDVFCEPGVFSADQAKRILEAGTKAGLKPKIHAEEFKASGGAELAVELGAVSADHLMAITERGIRSMKKGATVAVLLPGTSYFLGGTKYAPARVLVDEGVPVALGSDFNPGSCMTYNLQAVLSIACTQLRMLPSEALSAATINAAHACGVGDWVGSLEPGKRADLVVWEAPSVRYLAYQFGVNQARVVVKAGRRIR